MPKPNTNFMPLPGSDSFRLHLLRFALQAAVWVVISLAVATTLVIASPMSLPFGAAWMSSAVNWAPWALLTPGVFWLSQRFPLVRGQLARGFAAHFAGAAACTVATFWISRLMLQRGPGPFNVAGGGVVVSQSFGGISTGVPGEISVRYAQPGAPGAGFGAVVGGAGGEPLRVLHFNPNSPPMTPPGVNTGRVFSFGGGTVQLENDDASEARPPPMPARPGWAMQMLPLALQANFGFSIYLIIASVAHAIAFYRRAQDREHQALALVASRNQAKLDALRLQLQPHFLFNTLNAISALIQRRPAEANALVLNLGDLLRASLQTTEREVTLARELELLDRYLAIEQARLGARLRIVRDFPASVLGACVPTLILQPLAENAVRHGLEARIGPGTLTLRGREEHGMLVLSVIDDGVGFPATAFRDGAPSSAGVSPASAEGAGGDACATPACPRQAVLVRWRAKPESRGFPAPDLQLARRGIGLANTEERLRMLHDDRARFDLRPNPGGGVCVEITLPFRTEPVTPPGRAAAAASA